MFYGISGEYTGEGGNIVVRISATADAQASNELWMEQACSQVDELAKLTNIKPEYITIDNPSFANKISNPDTGTGFTLNQGSKNAFGLPEFVVKDGPANVANGYIYRYEGKTRTLIGEVGIKGNIHLY